MQFIKAYEQFKQDDGRYPASYEIIYGHAWRSDVESADNPVPARLAGIPINMMDQNK